MMMRIMNAPDSSIVESAYKDVDAVEPVNQKADDAWLLVEEKRTERM